MEALRTATINPAIYMGTEKSAGTIERGKNADLVLLEANPLDDIGNTKRIAAVVVRGRFLDRAGLDAILSNAEKISTPAAAVRPFARLTSWSRRSGECSTSLAAAIDWPPPPIKDSPTGGPSRR